MKRKICSQLLVAVLIASTVMSSVSIPAFAEDNNETDDNGTYYVDEPEQYTDDDETTGGDAPDDNQPGDDTDGDADYFDEYDYLWVTKRLSWGIVEAGSKLDYQTAYIDNYGSQAHPLHISVSSSDMWDVILPQNTTIPAGGELAVSIRPNLSSPKWGTGEYADVLTISGFDADCCNVTDTVSVNLYVTVQAKVTPWVSSVTVSPSNVAMSQGQVYTFGVDVSCGDGANNGVNWLLQGNNSKKTTLSNGVLKVAEDETSTALMVIAKSVENPSIQGMAYVSVSKNNFTVSVQGNPYDGGSVAGGGKFNNGDTCSIVANPASGYNFDGWYENNSKVSDKSKYSFTVNSSRTLVAVFSQNKIRINTKKNIEQAGTVTESKTIAYGGNYTITAKANQGYKFVGWYEGQNLVTNSATYEMKNITASRELNAVFEKTSYTVALNASPKDGGAISGGGNYKPGEQINLKAVPNKGYKFVGWYCNNALISVDASCVLYNVDKDYSITAVFMPEKIEDKTFTIDASCNTGGVISPNGKITAFGGKTIVISISPNKDYRIKDVVVDGKSQGAVTTYSFYNMANNHTITVTFEPISGVAPAKKTENTTAKEASTGTSTQSSDVAPTTDEITKADDVTRVTTMTGTLQDLNITPDEAKVLIQNKSDRQLMENALVRGDLQVTVNNKFADENDETSEMSYYDIPSVPNMEAVIDSILTEEEKLELFEGTLVRTNLNIGALTDSEVDNTEKSIFADNTSKLGIELDSYFDINLIYDVDGYPQLVTSMEEPLRIVLNIPDRMKGEGEGCVLRLHNGEFTVLEDLDDNPDTITFETDMMSTFAIGYHSGNAAQNIDNGNGTGTDAANAGSNNSADQSVKTSTNKDRNVIIGAILVIMACMITIVVIMMSSSGKRKHKRK